MVTLKMVAKKAGVSPATVSRVINNSDYVSQDVRQKVEKAIEALGYVPNNAARALVKKKPMLLVWLSIIFMILSFMI